MCRQNGSPGRRGAEGHVALQDPCTCGWLQPHLLQWQLAGCERVWLADACILAWAACRPRDRAKHLPPWHCQPCRASHRQDVVKLRHPVAHALLLSGKLGEALTACWNVREQLDHDPATREACEGLHMLPMTGSAKTTAQAVALAAPGLRRNHAVCLLQMHPFFPEVCTALPQTATAAS